MTDCGANDFQLMKRKDCFMKNCEQMHKKRHISVFFAADERYIKYLAVALASLSRFAKDEYQYDVRILSEGFSHRGACRLRDMVKPNVKITVCDMEKRISNLRESLTFRLRDYYSEAIYYRMFIPSMFPELKKAVYLDADIVLNRDVADLFLTDIGDNLIGAVTDESVITVPVFRDYVKRQIGIGEPEEYFNSGVLLMNLDAMRKERIEEKFLHLLTRYNFNTVAPDQDYLNFLCRGKLQYLPCGWNKHAIEGRDIPKSRLYLIHFNMFNKPWHYDRVPMEKLFWDNARLTPFYEELIEAKRDYSENEQKKDTEAAKRLLSLAEKIYTSDRSISETVYEGFFDMALGSSIL